MTTEYESLISLESVDAANSPWSEEVAQRIAAAEGLGELSVAHWKVIHTLRQHFVQYGALPPMRLACGLNHLAPHCSEELFHGDFEAWRVAGLPQPGSEAVSCL